MKLPALFFRGLLCLLSGCAVPRVIVFKDPLTAQEHLDIGLSYEKEEMYDLAILHYRKAARDSRLSSAFFFLGNAFLEKGNYAQAEAAYREALRVDPSNADLHNNLAWLYYLRRKNLSKAEELAKEAIHLNPDRADVYEDTLKKIRSARLQ